MSVIHASRRITKILLLSLGVMLILALTVSGKAMARGNSITVSGSCTDTVSWQGIGGTVTADSCATGVFEQGICPGAPNLLSNTVSAPGDAFGFGTDYDDWAEPCEDNGQSPITKLFFYEHGAAVQISSSIYGSGEGTFTRSWTF